MAIKVNGTTVIDNSRNLTNIASADAATVAALGAAGVGGATKLITADAALGSASTYTFSLTGRYNAYFLLVTDLVHAHSAECDIVARVTDTSNNAITAATYDTFVDIGSSVSSAPSNTFFKIMPQVYQSGYSGNCSFGLWLYNAHISTAPTTMSFNGLKKWFGSQSGGSSGFGIRGASEINNALVLLPITTSSGSTPSSFTSGRYSMWGVDL